MATDRMVGTEAGNRSCEALPKPDAALPLAAAAALLATLDERHLPKNAAEQARRLFAADWAAMLHAPGEDSQHEACVAGLTTRQFSAIARPWGPALQNLAQARRPRRGTVVLARGVVALRVQTGNYRAAVLLVGGAPERLEVQAEAVAAYARLVGLVWQRARIQWEDRARVQRQVGRLNAAAEVGEAIRSVQSIEVVLERIVHQTAAATGTKASSMVLVDEQRQGAYIAATYGIDLQGTWIPKDHAATWHVILTGRPFEVLDGQTDERFPALQAFARQAGTHTCLSVPLVVRDVTIGSLDIHSAEARHFPRQDKRLLQVIASQAAIAIENARLYGSIERERGLLAAVVEGVRDGLILENESGRVLYANKTACDLLGLPGAEVQNVDLEAVYTRLAALSSEHDQLARQLVAAARQHDQGQWIDVPLSGSAEADLRVRIVEVSRGPNEPAWYLHLLHDVRSEHAAERAKSVLLSTVSHELRTPLTSIKGFVTSLLSADVEWGPATQRDFLQEINAEADNLCALVDNLLDLSKLESGVLLVRKQWTDLGALVRRVVEQSSLEFREHGFTAHVEPGLPVAFIDPVRIREVLRNLLENTAKYTPPGTAVKVSARCEGTELLVRVEDDGPGLPAWALDHIFERFFRYVPQGKQIPGTGLGLAICRGLVEAHGGRMQAESAAGAGMRVTFFLPLVTVESQPTEEDDLQGLTLVEARE